MPQVKGSGSWLANTRQDTPDQRVRLDYSSPQIENDRLEEDTRRTMDDLFCQQHRALADRTHSIREARDMVRDYTHMRVIMKKQKIDQLRETRRMLQDKQEQDQRQQEEQQRLEKQRRLHSAGTAFGRRTRSSSAVSGDTGRRRPMTAMARTSGFSNVDIGAYDDDEMDNVFTPEGFNSKHKWANTVLPVTNGRRPRRPKTSYQPRSRREIRQTLLAEFQAKNAQGKTRSFPDGNSTAPVGAKSQDGEKDKPVRQSSAPAVGRSFQELKSTSNLDKLQDYEKMSHRVSALEKLNQQREMEHKELTSRISSFYKDLEDFKWRTRDARGFQLQLRSCRSLHNVIY